MYYKMKRKSFVRVSYAIEGSELEQPTVHEVQTAMVYMCICVHLFLYIIIIVDMCMRARVCVCVYVYV